MVSVPRCSRWRRQRTVWQRWRWRTLWQQVAMRVCQSCQRCLQRRRASCHPQCRHRSNRSSHCCRLPQDLVVRSPNYSDCLWSCVLVHRCGNGVVSCHRTLLHRLQLPEQLPRRSQSCWPTASVGRHLNIHLCQSWGMCEHISAGEMLFTLTLRASRRMYDSFSLVGL